MSGTGRAGTSAGRVIAGTARGIRLAAPGEGTRPMGDRVKQTLFAIVEPAIRGRAFLDLFAGSGAGGIEARSRGAARAVFVERDGGAVAVIRRNLAAAHLDDAASVVAKADATTWLRAEGAAAGPFGVVLLDPPYDHPELVTAALATIAAAGPGRILAADGVVVTKHAWRTPPPAEVGLLASERERRFGETTLTFHRWADADGVEGQENG
jgi:16S rRNA (guanine966-N2)-methyltransferase